MISPAETGGGGGRHEGCLDPQAAGAADSAQLPASSHAEGPLQGGAHPCRAQRGRPAAQRLPQGVGFRV